VVFDRQEIALSPHQLALSQSSSPWGQRLREAVHFIDVWACHDLAYGKHILMLAQQFVDGPQVFIDRLSEIAKRLDVGIQALSFEVAPDSPPLLISHHRDAKNQAVLFDFNEESDGTQRLLFLVAELIAHMTLGQTIVADEMDRSIHPVLFRALLRMCRSKVYNPHYGQLCFSTHDVSLLDASVILPEEVVLVGKVGNETRLETTSTLHAQQTPLSLKRFRERYIEGWYQNIPYPSL
jgi:AAA15 family ATPase/GTPase